MKRGGIVALGLCIALTTSGCSMSEKTQEQSKQALCSSAASSIASLRAGGDVARAVAGLIHDNTQDARVKQVAEAVADNGGDKTGREFLVTWLVKQCGK